MANGAQEQRTPELLEVSLSDQYHTAEELFNQSRPTPTYYLLLVISSVIVSAGLLLNSDAVVIGGVLVAPLLTPILFAALAIAAGKTASIPRMLLLLGRSALVVVATGFGMGFLFGTVPILLLNDNIEIAAILYFLVAAASGVAGAFAWARKDIAPVLPGIALAVSLLPPLVAIGLSFEQQDLIGLEFFVVIFLMNLFGILLGGSLVFFLLKFYRAGQVIEEKEREEAFKENLEKEGKEREKATSER